MPREKIRLSQAGAPLAYTLAGPPDNIIPLVSSVFIESASIVGGTISQNTLFYLTFRAISWLYCEPKSMMRTVSFGI